MPGIFLTATFCPAAFTAATTTPLLPRPSAFTGAYRLSILNTLLTWMGYIFNSQQETTISCDDEPMLRASPARGSAACRFSQQYLLRALQHHSTTTTISRYNDDDDEDDY
jgi:hypothetical protein